MKLSVALLVLFAANSATVEHKTTLRVDERVRILKQNIKDDLRSKHGIQVQPIDEPNEFKSYEHDDSPVTPIMESDERKKDDKFKLRKLKTEVTVPDTTPLFKSIVTERIPRNLRQRNYSFTQHRGTTTSVSKPVEIFYRKSYSYSSVDMNEPVPWLHCADMVSPFLAQAKKELTRPVKKTKKDHIVVRLIHLLSMNTTDFSKEEIYSVLYQISKLKIRFFSWDVSAMKMLLNVITKSFPGKIHTFKLIKSGLKKLFESWHLDTSNSTRLLLQARVFRPPCVNNDHTGSSRFVPGSTLTPPTVVKQVDDDDSGGDCQNRAHDHEHAN